MQMYRCVLALFVPHFFFLESCASRLWPILGNFEYTVNPRYNDTFVPKDVAIKMNLLLYKVFNEQIDK